jgi:hypothetical protein
MLRLNSYMSSSDFILKTPVVPPPPPSHRKLAEGEALGAQSVFLG